MSITVIKRRIGYVPEGKELDPQLMDVIGWSESLKAEDVGGKYLVRGIHQFADQQNENHRIYPRSLWECILAPGHRVHERLENRQLIGLLGHPQDGNVDPSKTSHVTTELNLESNGLVLGTSEILPTPEGKVTRTLFESKIRNGISSRGFGDSRQEEAGGSSVKILEDDFDLQGFDFVIDPSVPIAYPVPVSEEVEREVHNYNQLLKMIEERLEQFESGAACTTGCPLVRVEELLVYKEMLEGLVGEAKPPMYYVKAGGSVSATGQIVERARGLVQHIGAAVLKPSKAEVLPAPSREEIVISQGERTMAGDSSAPDVSRIEVKIDELGKAKEERNSQLHQEGQQLRRANEQMRRRMAAAESIIDASNRKVAQLSQRIESAKRLVQAGVRRARKERRHRVNLSKRLQAAEKLLQTSVGKVAQEKTRELVAYRKQLASRLPNPREALKALSEGRTIESCNRIYMSMSKMSGRRSHRESRRGRPVRTGRQGALPRTEARGEGAKRNPASAPTAQKKATTQEQKVTKALIHRATTGRPRSAVPTGDAKLG